MWPATIVQQLSRELPPEFSAEPRTHLGSYFEIDVVLTRMTNGSLPVRRRRLWRGSDGDLVAAGTDLSVGDRSERAI